MISENAAVTGDQFPMQFLEYVAQYQPKEELNRLAKYTIAAKVDEEELIAGRLVIYAAWVRSSVCLS